MSEQDSNAPASLEQEKMMSAMFASLVMQNTNMALIFLGHAPNPQTGEMTQDLDNARFFIDQLEMLAVKTKGNLNRQEEGILKQSLTNLRLAFVEAVSKPAEAGAAAKKETGAGETAPPTDEQETPSAQPAPEGEPAGEAAKIVGTEAESKTAEAESRKKFSKKY